MKSISKNRKTYTFLIISIFLLFTVLSLIPAEAIHMQGDGATFQLDKEDPLKYGVFIPGTNMMNTISIDGANQGEFTVMDWLGNFNPTFQEIIDYPGEDVSFLYPWYFDETYFPLYINSFTDNEYIAPWNHIILLVFIP